MAAEKKLNIRAEGDGKPTIVFVHGFGCELDDWESQLFGLSTGFKCVALDLPGHGASAMPGAPTIAALAAAVNAAKHRSGARKVILIGHSLGAKVIRQAYLQSSADVAGLVLVEGSLYLGDRDTLLEKAKASVDSVGFHAFARRLFQDMFLEGSDPGLRERLIARAQKIDPELGRELFFESVSWDTVWGVESLRRLAVPVLVLQATSFDSDFRRVPLRPGMTTHFMNTVASLVPNSVTKIVAGSGHFPMIEAAEAVNRSIREFAARLVAP